MLHDCDNHVTIYIPPLAHSIESNNNLSTEEYWYSYYYTKYPR